MDEKELMIHLVTFCDERMTISAEKLKESSLKHGVGYVMVYERNNLPLTFMHMAEPTIDVPKGAGLYIWKPFCIWHYMQGLPDNDILIYADAGQTFVSNVQAVINSMDQDIMMFSNGWKHVEWCKASVMHAINPTAYEVTHTKCGPLIGISAEYDNAPQTQASLIFFKVTPETRNFVKEWMLWCLMPGFCDDSPSKLPNYPTFAETRWDQSILCCLQIKYGYRLHWFPSLTNMHNKGSHPNDNYPAIVDHHRKRNPGATGGADSEW